MYNNYNKQTGAILPITTQGLLIWEMIKMLINIDPTSEIPIYMQIRQQIVSGIASGDLLPGDQLPSVRQLAYDIGINMHTVNKAYHILKGEGYVNVSGRRGATIADRQKVGPDEIKSIEIMITETINEARAKGISDNKFLEIINDLLARGGKNK